jgi:hypothetical protein
VSKILDKLKEAEAQRARIVAERSHVGAVRPVAERKEVELRTPRQAGPTLEMRARFSAGLAIAAALGIAFWLGAMVYREPVKPALAPVAMKPAPVLQLDRDVDAFTARLVKVKRK